MKTLYFVVPGDINTRTGGYRYDKKVIDGLVKSGWSVELVSLDGKYPFPDDITRQSAGCALAAIPEGALVVVDGLAFGVLPEQIRAHSQRLHFVALVHHPLALETGMDATDARALRSLETDSLGYAGHIITTSPSTAGSLRDYHVSAERISVICPGTDQTTIAQGSTTDTFNLLCVATLTPRKGHAVLLEALSGLLDLDWHLHCAGSTERDRETFTTLTQLCAQLGLESRVSFLGELNDDALATCFSKADLFVLASYHEGYGMVLDEAIACGLPIVATAGGAIADTVPDGAGLLVPAGDSLALADALRRVMQSVALMQTMQAAALTARQSLRSWDTVAIEFETALSRTQHSHV